MSWFANQGQPPNVPQPVGRAPGPQDRSGEAPPTLTQPFPGGLNGPNIPIGQIGIMPGEGQWWNQTPEPDLTEQDYINTQKRLEELSQYDPRYPVPIVGRNESDPRNNERDVLTRRMYQWDAQQRRDGGGGATTMPMHPPFGPIFGGGKDSTGMPLISDNWNPGNRGNGQVINQPNVLNMLGQASGAAAGVGTRMTGRSLTPGMSGAMVSLMSPDGKENQDVPVDQVQHWLGKGAQMVSGVGNVVRGMF